jgi:hypothetical protein
MHTEIYLNNEGILYVPLAVEMNGALGGQMQSFISNLAEIAYIRRGHNVACFKHWWTSMLACTIHKAVADAFINKSKKVLSVQSQKGLPFHLPTGAFMTSSAEGATGLHSLPTGN